MSGRHVVQIGYDDTVFVPGPGTDTVARQQAYLEEFRRIFPGSRMTMLTLTTLPAPAFESGGVRYIPVRFRRRVHITWRTLKALGALHRADPIDIIATQTLHEEGLGALLFGRRAGIPVIGQIHFDIFSETALRENLGSGIRKAVRWWLIRRTLRGYRALRVVGESIARRLRGEGLHGNVHVIPVFSSMLRDARPPREGGRQCRVLFVGRLEAAKRLDLWLEVAKAVSGRMPEALFDIVGEGSWRSAMERKAADLGLKDRVLFHGQVAYGDLHAFYESARVFLLTSRYEGFGRVLVEANFHGLPAVSTDITGAEDIIVDGETGHLAAFGDVTALAEKVVSLLSDPEAARRMGEAARNRVLAEYHPDRLVRRWVGVWAEYARGKDRHTYISGQDGPIAGSTQDPRTHHDPQAQAD